MLRAFKGRDIQNAKQILVQCLQEELTINECLSSLTTMIEQGAKAVNPCPDCGTEMFPVATNERYADMKDPLEAENYSLAIMGCSKCGKSAIKERKQ